MNTKFTSYTLRMRGIFLIILAVLTFSTMDAVVKYLSHYYSVPFLVWNRFMIHTLFLLLVLLPWLKKNLLRTKNLPLQIVRSILMFGTTLLFFFALKFFTLAEATTVLFISPILLIAISPLMLGEYPTRKEWIMVLIGFVGMLIILRPNNGNFLSPVILFPLGAACCFTLFQVATRKLNSENPFTTLFYTGLFGAWIMSFIVPFHWVVPASHHLLPLLLLGILGAAGHFVLIKAFSYAPAPVLAPFIYTQLIWATLLGFIFFAELPDGWSIAGMIIIGAVGIISSIIKPSSHMGNDRRMKPDQQVATERRSKVI